MLFLTQKGKAAKCAEDTPSRKMFRCSQLLPYNASHSELVSREAQLHLMRRPLCRCCRARHPTPSLPIVHRLPALLRRKPLLFFRDDLPSRLRRVAGIDYMRVKYLSRQVFFMVVATLACVDIARSFTSFNRFRTCVSFLSFYGHNPRESCVSG